MRKEGNIIPVEINAHIFTLLGNQVILSVIRDITKRKGADEEAKKAAENVRTLLNSIDEMVFVFDQNGFILKANEAVKKRLQYTDKEIIGMHVLQINVPERRGETYAIFSGILDGTATTCPVPVIAKDGTRIEVETKVVRGTWDDMEVFIGVSRDVTERNKAEVELRESEERFKTLANAALEGILIHENGIILDCNPKFAEMFGYEQKEIIGRNGFKFMLTPKSRGLIFEWRQNGAKGTIDIVGIRKDKTEFYGETSTTNINWHGKQHSMVHMYDITERKKAEEALRESEERLRLKLDSVLSPEIDLGEQDLAQIIDTASIQSMFNDFHQITGMPIGIVDLKGNVLVHVGWQDICTKFHRLHPETLKNCIESNRILSKGVSKGEFRAYRCRNNMWDIVTPIFIGNKHVGNMFFGQFLYDDEKPDLQLFIKTAQQFGFDKDEYLEALNRVPRWSREKIQNTMKFYAKFAELISKLSYSNLKLAKIIANQNLNFNS